MTVILETPRLVLRKLTQDDLDFLAELLGDAEVMRFYPRALDRDGAQAWLDRQLARYARDGHGMWLVQDRATGAPRGQVGLAMQDVDGTREPEIGWLMHRPYWREGLATEAALAVRGYAFETRGYDHVISLIRDVNAPSQGVARKIGMTPWKTAMFHQYEQIVFRIDRGNLSA